MKALIRSVIIACAMLAVAACSTEQTNKVVDGLANFNRGVAAVDETIANVSTTLYKYCKSIQAVAQAADDITGTCNKASPVVDAGNAAIKSLCQTNQIADISSSVVAAASTVSAVKSQLSAAKTACAGGG